jgi:hypothetical protein
MKHIVMYIASFLFINLLLCIFFQEADSFSGNFGTPFNVLGANLHTSVDPKTGFVSGRASRLNMYGETSSVSYHLKPSEQKLQLHLDRVTSCFEVRCLGSQVILRSKLSLHDLEGCTKNGIISLTSSVRTTGRLLRYDLQLQPSMSNLGIGDFVYSGQTCGHLEESQARLIVSIDRMSDVKERSKTAMFVINTKKATLADSITQGFFEFRTDNILTVNDVQQSVHFKPRSRLGSRRLPLIDLVGTCVCV